LSITRRPVCRASLPENSGIESLVALSVTVADLEFVLIEGYNIDARTVGGLEITRDNNTQDQKSPPIRFGGLLL
jgi:hypothetical protein